MSSTRNIFSNKLPRTYKYATERSPISGGDDNTQTFPVFFPLVPLVYVTQTKVHVASQPCQTVITNNICVKRTVGQVANKGKCTERSVRASSRCTCGWSITRLLSGLDKIVVLTCVNHQAYNYPYHYMNSVMCKRHLEDCN